MKQNSLFSKLISRLALPEVFLSVTKSLPGEWHLFEYYVDEKSELIHFQSKDLKRENQKMVLKLTENDFVVESEIPIPLVQRLQNGQWSVVKNFIMFMDSVNFRNNIEFQFALEKGTLKLLKKNERGMIEFFGFFKPVGENQKSRKSS